MSKKLLGEDLPFPKFIQLKIRRRNGVAYLTILEEGEFKLAIDGCIKGDSLKWLLLTIEFGTIHHYSSLKENSEACLCSYLDKYKN